MKPEEFRQRIATSPLFVQLLSARLTLPDFRSRTETDFRFERPTYSFSFAAQFAPLKVRADQACLQTANFYEKTETLNLIYNCNEKLMTFFSEIIVNN